MSKLSDFRVDHVALSRNAVNVIAGPCSSIKRRAFFKALANAATLRAAALARLTTGDLSPLPIAETYLHGVENLGGIRVLGTGQLPAGAETIGDYLEAPPLIFNLFRDNARRFCPRCSQHSPIHKDLIGKLTTEQIERSLLAEYNEGFVTISACIRSKNEESLITRLHTATYAFSGNLRLEMEFCDPRTAITNGEAEIVLDCLEVTKGNLQRINDSIRQARRMRAFAVSLRTTDPKEPQFTNSRRLYPLSQACLICGYESFEMTSALFNLRSPGLGLLPEQKDEFLQMQAEDLPLSEMLNCSFCGLQELLSAKSASFGEMRELVSHMVKLGLADFSLSDSCKKLSEVERLKLMLIREVVCPQRAETLLIQEPGFTAHEHDLTQIFSLLQDLSEQGRTVILADNHSLSHRLADRVEWLADCDNEQTAGKRSTHHSCARTQVDNIMGLSIPSGKLVCIRSPASLARSQLFDEIPKLLPRDSRIVTIYSRAPSPNPYSFVATLSGLFDPIRDIYARLNISRMRGYTRNTFSLASSSRGKGTSGRCRICAGSGISREVAHSDIRHPCPACNGRRFSGEALEVKYKELSISEMLDLSIRESAPFISTLPKCRPILEALSLFELDYLKLGLPAQELSQSELTRLEVACSMREGQSASTYLLEAPCAGLCEREVQVLLSIFMEKLKEGHTIVVKDNHPEFGFGCDLVYELLMM